MGGSWYESIYSIRSCSNGEEGVEDGDDEGDDEPPPLPLLLRGKSCTYLVKGKKGGKKRKEERTGRGRRVEECWGKEFTHALVLVL
jgi:hypothetical protein